MRPRHRRWIAAILLSCTAGLSCFVGAGTAQAGEPPNQAAKRLYLSATHHFDLQEYSQALADFKEAYRLKPDPVFLFNIAQSHRLLGEREEAVRAYKTYLARSASAPNRTEVEAKISTLEQEIAAERQRKADDERRAAEAKAERERQAAASTAAPSAVIVAAPPPRKPIYKRAAFWGGLAGGVVAVGLGVGLGVGLTRPKGDPTFPTAAF